MAFARLEIKVNGAKSVERALEKYGEDAEKQIYAVLLENAKRISERAKALAPKGKTGDLKRSIRYGKAIGQGPLAVRVYSGGVRYAPYQEFGTGRPASAYVPTLPSEIQKIAQRYRGKGGKNPNITPKKFIWNSVVNQQPLILSSVEKTLNILELRNL